MLFSNVILTLHQQEVESNFSLLLSGLALVIRLICQRQCIGISEVRSQAAYLSILTCALRRSLRSQLLGSEKERLV